MKKYRSAHGERIIADRTETIEVSSNYWSAVANRKHSYQIQCWGILSFNNPRPSLLKVIPAAFTQQTLYSAADAYVLLTICVIIVINYYMLCL